MSFNSLTKKLFIDKFSFFVVCCFGNNEKTAENEKFKMTKNCQSKIITSSFADCYPLDPQKNITSTKNGDGWWWESMSNFNDTFFFLLQAKRINNKWWKNILISSQDAFAIYSNTYYYNKESENITCQEFHFFSVSLFHVLWKFLTTSSFTRK